MIDLRTEAYIVGVWFIRLPEEGNDLMACLFRPRFKENDWRFECRARQYEDGKVVLRKLKPFAKKLKGVSVIEAKQVIDSSMRIMASEWGTEYKYAAVGGDGNKLSELVAAGKYPWLSENK